jgi:mRNA degradation ribonuclease J1/J2
VVATFASNIHRVQQIIDVAQSRGRKVAVTGRSLENLVQVGQDLGYLNVPENILIPIDAIKRYPDDKLVIHLALAMLLQQQFLIECQLATYMLLVAKTNTISLNSDMT